uniref:Small ribosomal subunit protein uS15 N-terminal domain-containing protein n=1 Tax=Catagonus wagneri TaxID=51154 RepID=A0A8C3VS01_9CETA
MGRMHAPGKGLSQSALPYHRSVPTWLKLTLKEQIYKLAKKGLTPSQIGCLYSPTYWWFYTHTMGYYAASKRKEILTPAMTGRRNPEDTEKQTQKDKSCVSQLPDSGPRRS